MEAPVDNAELRSILGAGGWKLRSMIVAAGRVVRLDGGHAARFAALRAAMPAGGRRSEPQ